MVRYVDRAAGGWTLLGERARANRALQHPSPSRPLTLRCGRPDPWPPRVPRFEICPKRGPRDFPVAAALPLTTAEAPLVAEHPERIGSVSALLGREAQGEPLLRARQAVELNHGKLRARGEDLDRNETARPIEVEGDPG